jgi:hypothetical protein
VSSHSSKAAVVEQRLGWKAQRLSQDFKELLPPHLILLIIFIAPDNSVVDLYQCDSRS